MEVNGKAMVAFWSLLAVEVIAAILALASRHGAA